MGPPISVGPQRLGQTCNHGAIVPILVIYKPQNDKNRIMEKLKIIATKKTTSHQNYTIL
jgi:hypothetical protein